MKKVFIKSISCNTCPNKKYIPNIFSDIISKKIHTINLDKLDDNVINRIEYMIRNNIFFISGTMSPADKTDTELEPIHTPIEYYKKHNINKLVIQPKYMGSRGNLYLNVEQPHNSKLVTRKGYIASLPRHINGYLREKIYPQLANMVKERLGNNVKQIILDGEILPWGLLGYGLIRDTFRYIEEMLNYEYGMLEKYGFKDIVNKNLEWFDNFINNKIIDKDTGREIGMAEADKKYIIDNYGYHIYDKFKTISHNKDEILSLIHLLENKDKYMEMYNNQLDNYTIKETEISFKPFMILKIIDKNDKQYIPYFGDKFNGLEIDNYITFHIFRELHEFKPIVIETDYYDISVNIAKEYFNKLSYENGYEGVVIKPLDPTILDIVPYFKVRNEEYLTLVYGPDYKTNYKYQRILENKDNSRKKRISIDEMRIGVEMLKHNEETKYDEYFKKLIAIFHTLEEEENTLDPRL